MAQEESNNGFILLQVIILGFIAAVFLQSINKDLIFNFRILNHKKKNEIINCGEYKKNNSIWRCKEINEKKYFEYGIE